MKKLNVAIIGQGRSGRDIHGKYFKNEVNKYYNVVAVAEFDPERRKRAVEEYPGCVAVEDYREFYNMDGIDLVLNATYSEMHYAVTKDLLEHKCNVLVEKPFARNYYECTDLIRIAKENNVVLAVFQQSFFAPYYVFTKEVLESGKLGDILSVDITFNGFARRWDWQTLQCKMAGCTYNTGPHPIGLALDFLDFSPETNVLYSKMHNAMASGDAEDWSRIILTAPGKPLVEVQICPTDAFADHFIKIQGTRGTYRCSVNKYELKYYSDDENRQQPIVFESLKDDEGLPAYCSENLVTHEESGSIEGDGFNVAVSDFYEMLYNTLVNGEPLKITPEMAADIVRVIEVAHGQNPMPTKY